MPYRVALSPVRKPAGPRCRYRCRRRLNCRRLNPSIPSMGGQNRFGVSWGHVYFRTTIFLDFLDAAARNVYPTGDSKLKDAGSAAYASLSDFNGTPRSGTPDAGAYAWTGPSNPGWVVGPRFKNSAALDTIPPAPPLDLRGR